MKTINLRHLPYKKNYRLLLLLLATAFATGCDLSSSGSDGDSPSGSPLSVTHQYILNVRSDQGGNVDNVSVSSSTFNVSSPTHNGNGQVIINLEEHNSSGTLRVSKPGFIDAIVPVDAAIMPQRLAITMLKRDPAIVVDMSVGGEFSASDGSKIVIDPSSLQNANGNTVSGPVDLFFSNVDIQDPTEREAFPGSFLGATTVTTGAVSLHSYGVSEIEFQLNGEKLQLRDGFTASLTLPIYATRHLDGTLIQTGDSIPFWILDEESGMWMHENDGVVINEPLAPNGFALQVNTSHFSWFNTDEWRSPGDGGAGNGNGGNTRPCSLSLDIVGLEQNEAFTLTFQRRIPGWPSSNITRNLVFTGSTVNSSLLPGAAYALIARDTDGNTVEQTVSCSNGENIFAQLTLGEPTTPPQFANWGVEVEPVFTKNQDGLYEINENTVTYGGIFRNDTDDIVEVSGNIILTLSSQFQELANGTYDETRFINVNNNNATIINAKLSNDVGETSQDFLVNYISQSTPKVTSLRIYHLGDTGTTSFGWTAEGADEITIETVAAADPIVTGNLIIPTQTESINVESGFHDTMLLSDYSGYIRIIFRNQYGDTTLYRAITKSTFCIPNSDMPCMAKIFSAVLTSIPAPSGSTFKTLTTPSSTSMA